MKITVTKDRMKTIVDEIKALTKKETLVGVPYEKAPRSAEEDEARKTNGEPINNAEIGYINEFGVPEKNIPARPHLIPGIESVKDRIGTILVNGAKKALSGDEKAAEVALGKVGIVGSNAVIERISDGLTPALSPVTLAHRKAKGRTGEMPLVDTGAYRQSITSVVRDKGAKS